MNMKHIKSFVLLGAMALLAACSSDDANYNSDDSVTIGFADTEVVKKENSGMFNVPITITGKRNGDVSLDIEVVSDGDAVEDKHYLITSKHLQLLSDTTTTATLNVQIKTIDDTEINENRTFKLKLVNVQGAKVVTEQVNIVLRDNDAAFFEKFFGKWTFTAYDSEGNEFERTITISGPSDEEDPKYNKVLTATGTSFLNVGVALNFEWHFNYSFDTATKTGTLGFVMNETISTYSTAYEWIWLTDDGTNYVTDDLTAQWALGEGDTFPTEIKWAQTFESDGPALWFYQPGAGWWEKFTSVKITKQ